MENLGLNSVTILDFYKGKRVFITGHTGFKGAWLSRILLRSGAEVTGYALPPDTDPSLFDILRLADDMRSVNGDIRDIESLKNAISQADPEIIIHMAAQPIVIEGYKNPVYTYDVNIMGTVNLLESAREAKSLVSLVNVTTDKVYENKEQAQGYMESDSLCGSDPYSNSKSCSELVTFSYKKSFFSGSGAPAVSTARSGNVIGGGDYADFRIIPDCVRAMRKKMPAEIRNPLATRPYQHVLDCLSGYLLLAKKQYEDRTFAGNYNFGPSPDDNVTNEELVRIFCEAWGEGASYKAEPSEGPPETNVLRLDITKSRNILGWIPTWNIRTAINRTAEWEKSGQNAIRETDIQAGDFFESMRTL